jgi:hypothetical protein
MRLRLPGRLTALIDRSRIVIAYRSSMAKGLNLDSDQRRAHVEAMRATVENASVERVHAWIHTNLIILDSKAQAILALYSLELAALTVLYSEISGRAPLWVLIVAFLNFVIVAWSIVPLARICFVYWSTTEEFNEPQLMLEDLLRVRDQRSLIVRRAVMKGLYSIFLFGLLISWDVGSRL